MKAKHNVASILANILATLALLSLFVFMSVTLIYSLGTLFNGDEYMYGLEFVAHTTYLKVILGVISLFLLFITFKSVNRISRYTANHYAKKYLGLSIPTIIKPKITKYEESVEDSGWLKTRTIYDVTIENTTYNIGSSKNVGFDLSNHTIKYLPLPKSISNMKEDGRIKVDNFYYNFCSKELCFFYIDSFIFKNKYLFNKNTRQIIRISSEHFKTPMLSILIAILGFIFFYSSLLAYVCFFTNYPKFLPLAVYISSMIVVGFFLAKSSYEDDIAIEYLLKHLDKI